MSTITAPDAASSLTWEADTTTTMGERFPLHAYDARTVEPARQDRAQLLGVLLAGERRPLGWPKAYERAPDMRITSRYILTLELTDDIRVEAGDAREFVSPSASLSTMFSVFFAGRRSSLIEPRTALGKRLLELRQRIIASGAPLLDWNDLEKETRSRRGERD